MRRMTVLAGACVALLAGVSLVAQQSRGAAAGQTPTLQSAVAALSATSLRALKFTATGRSLSWTPPTRGTWPARREEYEAQIAYGLRYPHRAGATMPTPARFGGGGAITGDRQVVRCGGTRGVRTRPPAGAAALRRPSHGGGRAVIWVGGDTAGPGQSRGATPGEPVAAGARSSLPLGTVPIPRALNS